MALYERVTYDADGRNVTATLRRLRGARRPGRAAGRGGFIQTPSPWTEHGVKGGGEGGRMIAPPAVTRAVEDALAPFGARIDELPITRDRIVEATGGGRAPIS